MWRHILKLKLIRKIQEAVDQTTDELEEGDNLGTFPYLGDKCFEFMADAAIAVLLGMEDAQKYMEENDMLKDDD